VDQQELHGAVNLVFPCHAGCPIMRDNNDYEPCALLGRCCVRAHLSCGF
jgi:hypothetical protein